jgi:hypothetical protein
LSKALGIAKKAACPLTFNSWIDVILIKVCIGVLLQHHGIEKSILVSPIIKTIADHLKTIASPKEPIYHLVMPIYHFEIPIYHFVMPIYHLVI